MDDFLYNLRLNMDKRHTNADRKTANRKRKDEAAKSSFWENLIEGLGERLPQLQIQLAGIEEQQRRLAEAQARHAAAELRKAKALEAIARDIKSLIDSDKFGKDADKEFGATKSSAFDPSTVEE